MPTVEFFTVSTVSMTPKKRTSIFEVCRPSHLSSQPITVYHLCPGQARGTLRGPAAEKEIQGWGQVYIRVSRRGQWREEWGQSRTRRGPAANKMQRKGSSTNSTTAISHPSPHTTITTTTTIPIHINSIPTIHSTHYPWRRSTVGQWTDTRRHLQWNTARSTLRPWGSPSAPACTMARRKTEMQELGRGPRPPCPAMVETAQPLGLWGVEVAARADIWGPVAVVVVPRRG